MEQPSNDVHFDAGEFVRRMMADGSKTRCDDTNETFNNNFKLPSYYDETKMKRGQKFFHDHIFAMFYVKMMGLLTGLLTSIAYDVLKFTNKSSEPITAYKRYVSTVFHTYTWYNEDMSHDSKVWKSLGMVRHYHNSASKSCSSAGVGGITQAQMALTQFAFMGFAIVRSENVGIFDPNQEDLEGLVHFWRVIGYVMGIEERFNICRNSMSETKGICEEIIQQVLKPEVSKRDPMYLDMADALVQGLRAMVPFQDLKVWMKLAVELLHDKRVETFDLTLGQRIIYHFTRGFISLLRFRVVRITQKYNMHFMLYVKKRYPFLAYYTFGKANAYVPK